MHLVGKLPFPLYLFLLVVLRINRLCTSTHTRQTIYNQTYGYQTFKQNLQAHANTRVTSLPTGSYTLLRKEDEEDAFRLQIKHRLFFRYYFYVGISTCRTIDLSEYRPVCHNTDLSDQPVGITNCRNNDLDPQLHSNYSSKRTGIV